jgi:hypothetical protein
MRFADLVSKHTFLVATMYLLSFLPTTSRQVADVEEL